MKSSKPSNAPLLVAVLALIVSTLGQGFALRSGIDQSLRDAVERSYSTWLQVCRMQADFADVAHVFALPDRYQDVVLRVRAATGTATPELKARMELRERAAAVYMFTLYEATLYQQLQASRTGDPRRALYDDIANYMTQKALRNPRLLWWWKDGGVSTYFEKDTVEHFKKSVLDDPSTPKADPLGPYGM